jgi:putative polysaccharide biosynthesis protein
MARRWLAENLASVHRRGVRFFWRHCRAGFPWFWPARPSGRHAMVEARRMVRWHFGRDHHPVHRRLAQVLVTMTWFPTVLLSLWQVREWFGPWEAVLTRAPGALWAAIRHNVLPSEYYMYQLWQADHKKNIDNYLYFNESPRLFKVLNRRAQVDPVLDKLAFYELCKTHGIPTPEVLAVFAPTGKLTDFQSCLPPQHDLFVKARTGLGGEGAERFRWDGVLFQSNRGCRLRPEHLGSYLANRARVENLTLLVQPALSNHPDIRSEPNEALATARLVTGRSIYGEVTAIFCYMLWGVANKITAHSDCITLIDVANGRLMPAPPQDCSGMSIYQYRRFGFNDAYILPDWNAALRHVKAAHKACLNFVFIGWDVAFTPNGAMVLEGNTNWSPATYQTLYGEPLGLTKFADILATQLGHLG